MKEAPPLIWLLQQPLHVYIVPIKRQKHPYVRHTTQIPTRVKTIDLFVATSDGSGAFTLCFTSARAFCDGATHPLTPSLPILRPKPVKSAVNGFEAQITNPSAHGFEAQTSKPSSDDFEAQTTKSSIPGFVDQTSKPLCTPR
jgi:hypothetical protein